jgi:hypothetical protein|tara:strand:+ start:660 stop:1298 length:639 start_codon:yes stop_codon:yes gene_type:complete
MGFKILYNVRPLTSHIHPNKTKTKLKTEGQNKMIINFLNESNNNGEKLTEATQTALNSRSEDFNLFTGSPSIREVYNHLYNKQLKTELVQEVKDQRISQEDEFYTYIDNSEMQDTIQTSFAEYGLSFEYKEGEIDEETGDYSKEPYFCYLLSFGGPSEEVRFYENGAIEFVYMDWFCGCGVNVTRDETFINLKQYFEDCEMLDFESKRELAY